MSDRIINDISDLHHMLDAAIQLEHATIPPYLTALYSIHPETNIEASAAIRAVLVEEMLHMTLSANVLNAVGKHPDLTASDFVPDFPTRLPDGEKDFMVSIDKFSPETLDTFLKIERPSKTQDEDNQMGPRGCIVRNNHAEFQLKAISPKGAQEYSFYSIGDFYEAIIEGIEYLEAQANQSGNTIFTGDPSLQVSSKYYYSGGGHVIEVTDKATAIQALSSIIEQGEGHGHEIFDSEGEISHYYRFEQLKLGQFYQLGDEPGNPSGEKFKVDFEKVYPIKCNPKLTDYPQDSQIFAAAKAFNHNYQEFLSMVNKAFCGEQDLLLGAVCGMFRLKEHASQLIRNPIPNAPDSHGGPTFEITGQDMVQIDDDRCVTETV
ncbi:ferritin-like protein [Pseudoalteromonas luteoviolacea]|uniref:ferritin-like domain-containing protein n=1 Tax=Pseudoalteromonas luteoviolacea TaxID=43657 RepID=UPI001B35D070|nr:ferritin-like protein [Pseudoalteromonas luteoviolacea]MBQ4811084.1 ferritin-like protein [Pseudoalteromonas luteoviolacea]